MTLLRGVDLHGDRVDIRIDGGRITEVGRLTRRPGEESSDRGTVRPGFVDDHLHLHALAAAVASLDCGRTRDLAAALRMAMVDRGGWVRGIGYPGDDLDAAALDRLHGSRPVRIQHRSGALWMVNSLGVAALGLDHADHPGIERDFSGAPTGRIWRADDWLRTRTPAEIPDLGDVGRRLAGYGITAVTDATPDLDPATYGSFLTLPQRVTLLGVPLGDSAPAPLVTGPYKIVLADSSLPSLPELTDRIRAARAAGRSVAVHCVTREALLLLLAALDECGPPGPGDRIEHAALVPADVVGELARRGLTVVTQPGFIADRGDEYLRETDDPDDLYRVSSLIKAGVKVRLSSDAPYGPLDPREVIDAARHRRTRGGRIAGRNERITRRQALHAYLGPALRPGSRADLVLLDEAGSVKDVFIVGQRTPLRLAPRARTTVPYRPQ